MGWCHGHRMAALVRDLQAENQQLGAENQRVNGALEKVRVPPAWPGLFCPALTPQICC